ncbi:hypothetical protein [Methanonatronarchaeum sp. AMET-Sl]|uniref:hypothetical protein n=1 Tax=Methanonatronarchaeum sp. AMET-Sl TaxID=3037654 RepID=UPI00244E1F19|nr:hypothetical protein [Methanonatronarchaeum sp. AMET-Sl]WGI16822.1 hypothetical protein QEN48_04825 [Methanonatronarchaeum sp. AMET-Sl]
MFIKYLELSLLLITIIIVLFSVYGVQVSEVKYYRRGLTLIGLGFAFVLTAIFIDILGVNGTEITLYLTIAGYLFVLLGLILLTWFRKKLGL